MGNCKISDERLTSFVGLSDRKDLLEMVFVGVDLLSGFCFSSPELSGVDMDGVGFDVVFCRFEIM